MARTRLMGLYLLLALLAACVGDTSSQRPVDHGADDMPAPQSEEYENHWGDQIPAVLERAMKDAYAVPHPLTCESLVAEVRALDAVLGEDLDIRGGEPADEDAVAAVLVGAIKGLIPYRSWLRRLSGEDQRARRGLAAIAAGCVRRAYLKGVGEAHNCPWPAMPKRAVTGVADPPPT